MNSENYDFVIVGAGSAGCVLGNRLSASGRYSVLLLEAGPADRYLWIHIPIGYAKTMFHPVYNWGFYTDPDPNMHDRRVYWPRGRGLGGSSSINGLIYVRGQAQDYERWADAGNAGWGWHDVLPYFIKCEHNTRGASEYHGSSGPLWVSDIGEKHELMEAIIRAAAERGVPFNDDFNGTIQEGVGYYQLTTRNGWRCSTATAYLRPARRRANLRIETGAHAIGIVFDGRRAAGIRYIQRGREREARATHEVILSAGSLQTPQLLQISGVGNAKQLQVLGIPVTHHLPGVGENLQDHLQLRLMYKVSKPITINDDLQSPWRKMRMGIKWILFRRGPLAIGINQGGMFTRMLKESDSPDIQFHFATVSAEMAGAKPHPWSGCTFSVCQLRPLSRGTVFVRSRDPRAALGIQPNYLSHDTDRRCAVASIKYARHLAAAPALREYLAEEYRPGSAVRSDEELLDWARDYGATIFHPSGTCKMGCDPLAVVDARLRVHGLAGLRVVDCSIMPTLVSGNTNAPVIMIAEKASDMILQDHAAHPTPLVDLSPTI
ncbi:MAG: choline dehydrogenase [Betaproteobacteria bacterium CG2_30_68_42]|nr:MAG: choline dehydrogenase [Betaproteobacteria bacterium CG2_30_68_42]